MVGKIGPKELSMQSDSWKEELKVTNISKDTLNSVSHSAWQHLRKMSVQLPTGKREEVTETKPEITVEKKIPEWKDLGNLDNLNLEDKELEMIWRELSLELEKDELSKISQKNILSNSLSFTEESKNWLTSECPRETERRSTQPYLYTDPQDAEKPVGYQENSPEGSGKPLEHTGLMVTMEKIPSSMMTSIVGGLVSTTSAESWIVSSVVYRPKGDMSIWPTQLAYLQLTPCPANGTISINTGNGGSSQ